MVYAVILRADCGLARGGYNLRNGIRPRRAATQTHHRRRRNNVILAYGSLVSSVIAVDVAQTAYQKGKELMGILLRPAKNKFEAIGEERGRREGEAIMAARSAAWFADMQQAQKEGREFNDPPPWEQNGHDKDD